MLVGRHVRAGLANGPYFEGIAGERRGPHDAAWGGPGQVLAGGRRRAITRARPLTLSLVEHEPSQDSEDTIPDEAAVVALVDRAVSSRDAEAFGALYDRFVERVYRYLYYRTGSQAEAEDLTEQVFLKAWEAIERFQWHGRPFLAWLYRLAHNAHVDHLRRRRTTTSLNDDESPIDLPSETASRDLAQRLDAEVLSNAMTQLTLEQQQVLVLKFMEGFDTDQIARMMDKREGSIRALQMRALQSLRRVLAEQGEPGLA